VVAAAYSYCRRIDVEMGSVIPGSWSTPEQKEEHQGSLVQHVEQLPLPSPGLRHRPGDEEAPLFDPNLPTNELLDECLERHHITGRQIHQFMTRKRY
jgi:hypothetical protein